MTIRFATKLLIFLTLIPSSVFAGPLKCYEYASSPPPTASTQSPSGETVKIGMVDPVSTGSLYAEAVLRITGNLPVFVQTVTPYTPSFAGTFFPGSFNGIGISVSTPATPADIQNLKDLGVTHLIAGSELGVLATHHLSQALFEGKADRDIPGGKLEALKDKEAQQKILADHSLPNIQGKAVTTPEAAIAFWTSIGRPQVVVKPNDGAGTEDVVFTSEEAEIRKTVEKIVGKKSQLGTKNTHALIQVRALGDEYFIDTQSYFNPILKKTEHRVVNIAVYRKIDLGGKNPVYASIRILPYQGDVQAKLVAFIRPALDAMEIKSGSTHTEVIVDKNGNLFPIEFNFRDAGGLVPGFIRRYLLGPNDISQIEAAILRIWDPARLASTPEGWTITNELDISFLIAPRAGRYNRAAVERLSRLFPGVVREVFPANIEHGEWVPETSDLYTSIGKIIIAHPNPEVVTRVSEAITRMSLDGEFLLPE